MNIAQLTIDIVLFLLYTIAGVFLIMWILRFWQMYVNQKHMNDVNSKWKMLEILLPREITKSPQAFELIATNFLQTGGVSTWFHRKFKGNLPAFFSLEIASLEGVIHFYIRTHEKFANLITSNVYAQYPGVEVIEVEDYATKLRYEHNKKNSLFWGNSFILSNKHTLYPEVKDEHGKVKEEKIDIPGDYLPIRTYIDMGLEKDPKEEFKNDPLVQVIESLASIGKGQYAAVQLLVQDEKSSFNNSGGVASKKFLATYVDKKTHKHLTLEDVAKLRIAQLRERNIKKGTVVKDAYGYIEYEKPVQIGKDAEGKPIFGEPKPKTHQEDKVEKVKEMEITAGDKAELEAIGNKLSKPLLRCVLRVVSVQKKEAQGMFVQESLSMMKPFSYSGFNSFSLKNVSDPYDYPWQDTLKRRKGWRAEEIFDAFVEREGFYPHIGSRTGLDKWEDIFFFPYKGYVRRIWRMIIEGIVYPYDHPAADEVFVLNIEEVATLFHFPGLTAATPTLPRIDSKKGVAPVNLPQ